MRTFEFDRDTTVTPLGDGLWRAQVSERWGTGKSPNGGYLLALVIRALAGALRHPDPVTVTGHFLRAPGPGPVDIHIDAAPPGRTLSTATASLHQNGEECLRVLASYGDLSRSHRGRLTHLIGGPPELPPPEECLVGDGRMPDGRGPTPLSQRFDLLLHPETCGWAFDGPSGRPEVGGYARLRDGRDPDLAVVAVIADVFPPTAFELGAIGWVPTLELTLHGRARPAPGWLRVWVRSRFFAGGYAEEDAEVWDRAGTLVATSRQIARLPRGQVRIAGTAAPADGSGSHSRDASEP